MPHHHPIHSIYPFVRRIILQLVTYIRLFIVMLLRKNPPVPGDPQLRKVSRPNVIVLSLQSSKDLSLSISISSILGKFYGWMDQRLCFNQLSFFFFFFAKSSDECRVSIQLMMTNPLVEVVFFYSLTISDLEGIYGSYFLLSLELGGAGAGGRDKSGGWVSFFFVWVE